MEIDSVETVLHNCSSLVEYTNDNHVIRNRGNDSISNRCVPNHTKNIFLERFR